MSNQQRNELLQTIIADPNSTAAERSAAEKELNVHGQPEISQEVQDGELESYLCQTNGRAGDIRTLRAQLSPATQQILNDLGTILIGLIPPGGGERLNHLLGRTGSELVKQRILSGIRSLDYLIASEQDKLRGST